MKSKQPPGEPIRFLGLSLKMNTQPKKKIKNHGGEFFMELPNYPGVEPNKGAGSDAYGLSGKTSSLERRPTTISGKSRPAVTNAMCEPTMNEHLAPHGSLQ